MISNLDGNQFLTLTEAEFVFALRNGLGRAVLFARQVGTEAVEDALLQTCLHSPVFDEQVNGGVASWLYQFLQASEAGERIRQQIMAALQSAEISNDYDFGQLCALTTCIALDETVSEAERNAAAALIHQRAAEIIPNPDGDHWMISDHYVAIGGLGAAVEVAGWFGERLQKAQEAGEGYADSFFGYGSAELVFDDETIDAKLMQQLPALAKNEDRFAMYAQYREWAATPSEYRRSRPYANREEARKAWCKDKRAAYPLEKMLQDAAAGKGKIPVRYVNFGRCATSAELKTVHNILLKSTDTAEQIRLLQVFRRAPMPTVTDKVLAWATDDNGSLRWNAIAALAQKKDARIRTVALEKLANGALAGDDRDTLDLLTRNYQPGDWQPILQAVQQADLDRESCHAVAWDIADIAAKNDDHELCKPLRWAYENTPCMNCRMRILDKLERLGGLEQDILLECLWDASDEIQDFARARMQ